MAKIDILTPVGRLIAGSFYRANTQDAEGKPLVSKSGPNIGQPRIEYYFMVAVPKGGEQGWWQTPWGQLIYNVGATAFPQACQSLDFAWKVKDGDSTKPNKKGKRPCDMEGAKGCWLLGFTSGYPPEVTRENGNVKMPDEGAVKLGHFVQVFGNITDNGSQSQPGVFLNHSKVNFTAFGPEIFTGVDPATVGFGQNVVLPAGATMTPPGMAAMPGAGMPALLPGMPAMGMPAPGAAPMTPMTAHPGMPGSPIHMAAGAMPSPVAVQPHPGFLAPVVAAPPVPAAIAAPPRARQMTAAAQGPYEQYIAAGWTDAVLVQHGLMVA